MRLCNLYCSLSACALGTALNIGHAEDHSHHHHAAQNQHHNHNHGLGLHSDAPIGVMGDHVHAQGEWMFSYRYMRMQMDGMLDGTDSVSTSDLLNMTGDYQYMMVPTEMSMDMHMFGLMYALNDKLTFMAMLPYISNDMDMERRMGTPITFSMESSGIGDASIGAIYLLQSNDKHQLHANLRLSLPTGSIDEEDDTPMGDDMHLPYPMQLGSGTFDITPGITYLGLHQHLSWGAQAAATLRLGENANDYTLGNRLHVHSWIAYNKIPEASIVARLKLEQWGNIDGTDSELTISPMMNPNADPDLRGGSRVDLGLGINSSINNNHHIGLELLFPILQDLDGPQMEVTLTTVLGYKFHF